MNQNGIKEIQVNMDQIDRVGSQWLRKPNVSASELKHGLEVSKLATAHPTEVPMTPIMKNMLKAFGDIKEGERLLTGAPITRAEKWLNDTVESLLLQQSMKKTDSYDESLPICDIRHYWTQCWMNWDLNKFRDIGKGQVEEINETIAIYAKPTEAIDLRSKLSNDVVFAKAVEVVADSIPTVSATRNIVEIDLPFQTKHTNVGFVPGYDGFGNDRSTVKGTNLTYAQLTMQIAETIKDHPELLNKYNVTTEFSRYQRQKGRLINATARIVNLVLNQLEAIEIEAYKTKSPLFAGYNDAAHLKLYLEEIADFCEKNGYVCRNLDYHRYDWHICKQFIELLGAVSMLKCADKRSRDLAMYRAILMTRTWLVAGTLDKMLEIFGRIFSGFIDTNRGGGLINAFSMTYLLMKQDDHYVRDIVSRILHWLLVMGDDVLAVMKRETSLQRLQSDAKELGHEIDDASKIAFGPMFLQYRLFTINGKRIMIYAWPRVLRSALMKERSSGLGPCGWTLSWYQQLAKLIDFNHPEVTDFVAPVLNIIAYFDEEHLMLNVPLEKIFEGVRAEDTEALARNKRAVTTAEVLYDGDPSKAAQYDKSSGKINLSVNYFDQVRQVLIRAYDPNYLKNHSISVPKLATSNLK